MAPDHELCARYGTKIAESPLLEAAAAMLGTGGLLAEQHHVRRARELEAMAELAARREEAARMAPTRRGLRMPGGLVPQDATDYASAGSLRDMDPALGGLGFEKGGAVTPGGVGKLLGGLGMQGAGAASGALGRGAQAVGQGLQQGFGATGRLVRAAGPTLMEGIRPGAAPALGSALGGAGRALERGGSAVAGAGQNAVGAASRALKAPAVAPSILSKPLLSTGTKAKILGGAGALGAGYVGLKGLGAVRDYASIPAGAPHQGYLRSDVNEYGY
jgi:hypothetical protein